MPIQSTKSRQNAKQLQHGPQRIQNGARRYWRVKPCGLEGGKCGMLHEPKQGVYMLKVKEVSGMKTTRRESGQYARKGR